MQSPTPPSPAWEELRLVPPPPPDQLHNIKAHLDLVLLALESFGDIGSEAMLQAATDLQLVDFIGDRVSLWRLRQSNPLRKSQGGRKKLDVEEARSLVLIICYLAQQHQTPIRQAVATLEDCLDQGQPPHRHPLLGDYLDKFSNHYQERMVVAEGRSGEHLTNLAWKLLIDLLFYGAPRGYRRLWLALMDSSMDSV